jgi:hypothetical protein
MTDLAAASYVPQDSTTEKSATVRMLDLRTPAPEFLDEQKNSAPELPEILNTPPQDNTASEFAPPPPAPEFVKPLVRSPLGYTGASGIRPSEAQQSLDFVPIEDRWRAGFPDWQRYEQPNPRGVDQPFEKGNWWDPYNQNVLKGDYPIIGQHTFLNISAVNFMLHEFRHTPIPTTPFESTVSPGQTEFYGDPEQYFFINNLKLQFNLSHGDSSPSTGRFDLPQCSI